MSRLGGLSTIVTWQQSLVDLKEEVRKWGLKDVLLPTWDVSRKSHSVSLQVAVNGAWIPISCARFSTPEQNIRAVLQVVQMVRKANQRGITLTLLQAAEIAALPSADKDPCEILGLPKGTTNPQALRTAYLSLVQQHHPDHGGDPRTFIRIQKAAEQLGVS